MKRVACILLIVTILFSGLFIVANAHAQIPGSVTITSNTEWTVAQSPINFNGTVTVGSNATLTIDPGVTVNLERYYLFIYGALTAQGQADNQIIFESNANQTSQITPSEPIFISPGSTPWNAAINSGSIIQNAVLNSVSVNVEGSSPEIDTCVFNYATPFNSPLSVNGGSPQISNNIINYNVQSSGYSLTAISVSGGTPLITNNQFEGSSSGSSNVGIAVTSGVPVITSNTFGAQYGNNSDGIKVTSGSAQIISNQFNGNGYLTGIDDSSASAFTVSNNTFSSCFMGISAQARSILTVQGNSFLTGTDGIDIDTGAQVTITGNLIDGNSRYGINGGGSISSNTITNNQIGIHNPTTGVIGNNNIVANTQNSITSTTANIDAQNNWWGITDTTTINQTIYDSKIDHHLGTITFVPFLTQPSSSAPAIPSYTPTVTPIPTKQTPNPTPIDTPQTTPTPTPDQYSKTFAYQVGNIINLNLIATATAIALVLVWMIVILGYAAKRFISKSRTKK
ncbi:MAG: right-handed parallel beta-helix repeat-containing protein [Candidatus Bathyarchaeia archaeon]|jgi:hypothetical protein